MEMAGNSRLMTCGNLTGVPATSSLVRPISLYFPLSIYHVHAGCWWSSLLLAQSDRGLLAGPSLNCGGPAIVLHHDEAWIKGELYHCCELSIACIESIRR